MCINSRTELFSSAALAAFGACMAGGTNGNGNQRRHSDDHHLKYISQ